MSAMEEMENRLSSLERRLRAVEQPGKISHISYTMDPRKHALCCRSLADQHEKGGLGGVRQRTVQMRAGSEVCVLLEIRSVGFAGDAADPRGCAEIVSDSEDRTPPRRSKSFRVTLIREIPLRNS